MRQRLPGRAFCSCLRSVVLGSDFSGLWLAGNEGMEKKIETTIMGFTVSELCKYAWRHGVCSSS